MNTSSDVTTYARNLADAIAASDIAKARSEAFTALENSAGKTALMREYRRLSHEMRLNKLKGIAPTFEEEADLSLIYSKLCVSKECRYYLDAQAKYEKMLVDVYEILDSSIQYP